MRPSYAAHERKKRRTASRSLLLRLFVGVTAVIILALCVSSFLSQQQAFERLTAEQRRLERERDALYEEYESLKGMSEVVDSREYIERVARDYLGMVMPGDILIMPD
ncbi:MAG: FtsB family cell division protein [Saccharofermentanales bacterium]|jgi:cell division protein FtsB